MKTAFSTLACPDWTLEAAVNAADEMGYQGVEMRSFTNPCERMVNDPLSLEPERVAHLFDQTGVAPVGLATGVVYDTPIEPPVIGRVFLNEEAGVDETKSFVDFADRVGVHTVRVFGAHLPAAEPKTWSMRRIVERLSLASQTCRNTDVRLLIENSDSFARASDLMGLIERVDSPNLEASYNIQAAVNAGECPIEGVSVLGDALKIVRIGDVDDDGNPVLLGQGRFPLAKLFETLAGMDYRGWIVYEYPKHWCPELSGDARSVLGHAADSMFEWIKGAAATV